MSIDQKSRTVSRSLFIITLLLFCYYGSWSQQNPLSLETERPSARYEVGETIRMKIEGSDGAVKYRIWQDKNTPTLQTGEIQLQNGMGFIEFQHSEPNLLIVEVDQNSKKINRAVAVAPFEIDALEEEPDDFDEFWGEAKAELQAVPMNPELTPYSSDDYSTTYRINLSNISNRKVYGYISIPNGTGPFPAMLHLPSFGGDANQVRPQVNICRDLGAISMTISIHNSEPDVKDPNAYQPNDITDPYQNYYRQAVLACLQSINYIFTRSDFSGDLVVTGVSQGAGLAVMTAGLDERVKFLTYSGVTHGQHQGYQYDKASGFPYYLHQFRNSPQATQNAVQQAAQYYETIYFARRYKGIALSAIGYLDNITHASTQLPVFNALQGKKVLIHGKNIYHTHPSEFWRLQYDMTLQLFPYARQFAWQYATDKTGYRIEADQDTTISIQNSLQLNAIAQWNDMNLSNLNVEWAKVEGAGDLQFENANSLNPLLTFTTPGRYVLRLRIHDNRILESKAIYYTLEDKIIVEVEDIAAESQLSLQCPDDIEIFLPEGALVGEINWEDPSFESVCEEGAASLQQISGFKNGSTIPVGLHEIEYLVNNPCGDSLYCTLQLNVLFTEKDWGYCDSEGLQPWQEWIEEVRLNNLQFFSRKEGYGDFTHYTAELHPDSSYLMSIQMAYSYIDTTEYISAYIDFDQDSIFQMSELILQGAITVPTSSQAGMQILQATIATPPNVRLGRTRMRVILKRSSVPDACSEIEYGEVEDYSVVFIEKPKDNNAVVSTKNSYLQQLKLFPNPVNDVLQISVTSKSSEPTQLRIIDQLGRVIQQKNLVARLGENEWQMETQNLAHGFYILQFLSNGQSILQRKFVK